MLKRARVIKMIYKSKNLQFPMSKNMEKISGLKSGIFLLLRIAILVNLFPTGVSAEVQICEIKYGQKNLERSKSLERLTQLLNNKKESCYQIGNEFNKEGKAIPEKPIYACCHPE